MKEAKIIQKKPLSKRRIKSKQTRFVRRNKSSPLSKMPSIARFLNPMRW